MPRPRRPENRNNPLLQLRRLLRPGNKKYGLCVPQTVFADALGLSEVTIKAIETGKRRLTGSVLAKIRAQYGAHWSGAKWTLGKEGPDFSYSLSKLYRKSVHTTPAEIRQQDLDALIFRLRALSDAVDDRYWLLFVAELADYLEKCRQDYAKENTDIAFIFATTWPCYKSTTDPVSGKVTKLERYYQMTIKRGDKN